MDVSLFDDEARTVPAGASRRRVAGVLGGLSLVPLTGPFLSVAKKKKTKTLCLNGQTIRASGKKVKKFIKQGATPGACTGCTPQCNGTQCGSDGCGGTCGCNAGSVCNEGTCTACTVICTGTALACGTQLKLALADGGTVVACPGRYQQFFEVDKVTTLIGAGPGDDPAISTILDAQGTGTTALYVSTPGLFRMSRVRVTGAAEVGLSIANGVDARVDTCAIADNPSSAGGILARGALRITNSSVSGNTSASTGGGIYFSVAGPHSIDNCVIAGNTAATDGGGIHTVGAATDVTITATEIRGNTANRGGGIFMNNGKVRLDSATRITGNTATVTGGGVARMGGDFAQNGATISGNSTPECAGCV